MPMQEEYVQGSRTVEPFSASIEDTLPVDTSSPPTLHTPETGESRHGEENNRKGTGFISYVLRKNSKRI